jgi:hypothetical protein
MGPAGLVQTLKKVKPVGLKHALTGKQAARHTEESVAKQGGGHQKQAKSLWPTGSLEH